jgi:hypothetical protein
MPSQPSVTALFLFFIALGACLWRAPMADRRHVALSIIAGVVWCSLPIFEPSMRRWGYAFVVASFLMTALTQPLRRRFQDR